MAFYVLENDNQTTERGNAMVMAMLESPNASYNLERVSSRIIPESYKVIKSDATKDSTKEINQETQQKAALARRNKNLTEKGLSKRPVYCICRKEEQPGMIGCDFCDEWYHPLCLGLSNEEIKRLAEENWSCPICKSKKGKTPAEFRNNIWNPPHV